MNQELAGQSERNMVKVRKIIENNRRLTTHKISQKTKLPLITVYRIITIMLELVLWCARWVPKILTSAEFKKRKATCEENIFLNSLDPEFFQSQIVTGDETYIHHFEPETKRQSMQWLPKGSAAPVNAMKNCPNRISWQ